MKATLSLILTVLTFQFAMGEVATIRDSDGWANVRKAPNGKAEIIHIIYENEVFWYDDVPADKLQDWISIYIPKNDFSLGKSEPNYLAGFIHKSRLLPIGSLEAYSGEDFSFKYILSDFDSSNRIMDMEDDKWVNSIDGRPIWGTDGEVPKKQINSIEAKFGGNSLEIHRVFYSDIFECDNSFKFYKNGNTYFVHQWCSDGAGAYEIVWVLDKTGLQQRLVHSF